MFFFHTSCQFTLLSRKETHTKAGLDDSTKQSIVTAVFISYQSSTPTRTLVPLPCYSPALLSVSSRPSAQKQASWLCGSAVWKSPTKTSRSPRKTSCTRSRRAHRRGFTSNLQTFYISLTLTPSLSIAVWKRGGSSWVVCPPPQREFWYILCMSCLAYPTLLLPLCVKTINKRTKKKSVPALSVISFMLFLMIICRSVLARSTLSNLVCTEAASVDVRFLLDSCILSSSLCCNILR